MRLMVGDAGSGPAVFRVDQDATDLSGLGAGSDLTTFAGSPEMLAKAREHDGPRVALADIKPMLPIARPGKIICLGMNYARHAAELGTPPPEYPLLFARHATSLCPHDAPMVVPKASPQLDYEAELMAVIGTGGRALKGQAALDAVFGYTCFNDGSVRDFQMRTPLWTPGKNFDGTGPVGPVVVTADALPPGADGLRITSRINGETVQDSTTADMIFSTQRAIEVISEVMTLEPGDLIALGTPEGVGMALDPQRWLRERDVIEVEIEGIGVLRSPVVAER